MGSSGDSGGGAWGSYSPPLNAEVSLPNSPCPKMNDARYIKMLNAYDIAK